MTEYKRFPPLWSEAVTVQVPVCPTFSDCGPETPEMVGPPVVPVETILKLLLELQFVVPAWQTLIVYIPSGTILLKSITFPTDHE